MSASDILIMLLMASPFDYTDFIPKETPVTCKTSIRKFAKELDLYEISEAAPLENFKEQITCLREAFWKSYNCPPSKDVEKFPSYDCICQLRHFKHKHKEYLELRALTFPSEKDKCDLLIEEIENAWGPWDKLSDANMNYPLYQKRAYLGELRSIIGRDRYNNRAMPAPFPVTLFQSLDK